MNSDQVNDVLTLFALLILVDGKVKVEETHVMGRQLARLQSSLDPGVMFTPAMGVDWFKSNSAQLRSLLNSEDRDLYLKTSIHKLARLDKNLKLQIYYVLIRIAYADAEYHASERKLVDIAAQAWGLDLTKAVSQSG